MENTDDNPKNKYRHVCIKGINFKPDPKLLQALNKEATFERVEADVQVPQKTKLSREERLEKAKAIIEKNGFMTLYDYANAIFLLNIMFKLVQVLLQLCKLQ